MYKSASVKNFRCFDELVIGPLARFNLIAGKNSVGKTALLEALMVLHQYHRPNLAEIFNAVRGLGPSKSGEYLQELFHDFHSLQPIALSHTDDEGRSGNLHITITQHPTYTVPRPGDGPSAGAPVEFPRGLDSLLATGQLIEQEVRFDYDSPDGNKTTGYIFVGSHGVSYDAPGGLDEPQASFLAADKQVGLPLLAERLSEILMVKEEDKIADMLRIVEPRLKSLVVLQKSGVTMVYGDVGTRRLREIPLMGAGILRLLEIVLNLFHVRGGMLAIDEFENGLHYSILKKVWRTLAIHGRELDVQLFATTHSNECIRAAHEAFAEEGDYDFRFHRLESANGSIRAVTLDNETLGTALEAGWEVR